MKMQVREQGEEVLIELQGVAGRHHDVLDALMHGALTPAAGREAASDVNVRAAADEMIIRVRSRGGRHLEALSIYHHLRHALFEIPAAAREALPA